MKVLITGVAGYIGSHAAHALLTGGTGTVLGLDSLERGHAGAVRVLEELGGTRFRFVRMDLREAPALTELLQRERPDAVLHFAAWTLVGESVERPAAYWSANAGGTAALLEAVRAAGVRRFVLSSTAATYGVPARTPIQEDDPQAPISPYGASKLACEAMVRAEVEAARAAGRPFAAAMLRYFNVAGASADGLLGEDHRPETHLIPAALQAIRGDRPPLVLFGDDYPTPDGTCVRDFVEVEDLVQAHLRALAALRPGECRAYNVGLGEGFSVRQVLDACARAAGAPVPVEPGARRAGDPPVLVADARRIVAELGWSPRVRDPAQMAARMWRWMQSHPRGYEDAVTDRSSVPARG
ncbi:MAG: UDP-glucose 4-epimerase GalE [Phycisphaerales bacterium]